MKFILTKEDNVYFIDVFTRNTENNSEIKLGTVVLDMKRNSYYIIPTENKKYREELAEDFIKLMKELFIKKLSDNVQPDKLTGEIKVYSETILEQLINEYGIIEEEKLPKKQTKEEKEDAKYYMNLANYNKGYYPEQKMYN